LLIKNKTQIKKVNDNYVKTSTFYSPFLSTHQEPPQAEGGFINVVFIYFYGLC